MMATATGITIFTVMDTSMKRDMVIAIQKNIQSGC